MDSGDTLASSDNGASFLDRASRRTRLSETRNSVASNQAFTPSKRRPAAAITPRTDQRFADELLGRQVVLAEIAERDTMVHLHARRSQQFLEMGLDEPIEGRFVALTRGAPVHPALRLVG